MLKDKSVKGLVGTGIDVKKNKVFILVNDLSVKDEIQKTINSDMLEVFKVISIEDQVKPGDQIKTTQSYTCTVAFNAVIDGKDVAVTAGHCSKAPGGTGDWKFGSTTIGKWTANSTGSTTADAGYIALSSQSYVEALEKKTNIAIGRGDDYGLYDTVGSSISISAPSSSSLISASVLAQGVSLDFGGQNGYNVISDMRLVDTSFTQVGDSGAPVLQFRWNSDKNGYDFVVEGIHKGTITYQDENGQNKTVEIYSSFAGVKSAIGISALYVQ